MTKHKHNWHLIENLTKIKGVLNVHYFFICDVCGDLKSVKRGILKDEGQSK